MRRRAWLALLILAALLLAGCGGGSTAKRTVDARAEAMRFYPATAPIVALLDTNDAVAADRTAIASSLSRVPVWNDLRSAAEQRLKEAGIDPARVASLLRDNTDPAGLPTTGLSAGWTGSTNEVPQPLLVVAVSDRPEAMGRLFSKAADRGTLKRSGSLDDAQLYSDAGAAFAVRDGVVVSSENLAQVRAALRTRDGSSDGQLDDAAVTTLLSKLSADAALRIYINYPELRTHDAAVSDLADSPTGGWTQALDKVALGVHSDGYLTTVEVLGELSNETGLPVGEEPQRFDLASIDVRRAVDGGPSLSTPMLSLATELAPISIEAAVQGSELHARLRLYP